MLNLSLLGGFDASLNGHPLTGFSYNTMRALLAYLAIEPARDHRREFLAELLWEGQDMSTARGNLRRTLSDLRRVIEVPTGKNLFIADKQSLRFNPDLSVDVVSFKKPLPACNRPSEQHCQNCLKGLEQTVALYRGEFLQDFALTDCGAFDEWLLIQRETLHRHALALLERIANCHETMGHNADALPFALRYVALEPTDESGHRRVMRLYALDRQPGVALHQYLQCAQLLKRELAVLPEEATQRLARQIRLGEVGEALPAKTQNQQLKGLSSAQAERRQVTVFYCELNLKDDLDSDDPEEALERLHAPQAHCLEIVRRHGGHIVQAHGGGLLVYFGYPLANEHAARHAVNAALAIVRDSGTAIDARIGVHTGMIITGLDPSIPDTVGHTSRLAIQLRQSLAQNESGVIISPATYPIVKHYFNCVEMVGMTLPGATQANSSYRVERASGARSRLDTTAGLTAMVGRHAELEQLRTLWLQTKKGVGQVLLLQGEPGIGKSRLVHSFQQMVASDSAVIELRCFAESNHSPFHPIIALLESYFSLDRKDTPEQKLRKITDHLALNPAGQDEVALSLLATLFGLPLEEQQVQEMAMQEVKQRTSSLLVELILSIVAGKRALLIWEDLHWADFSTLEFLDQFIERARSTGIVLLLTARPGFVPRWTAAPVETLTLPPLDMDEMAQMITALDATLPHDTIARIIERADGIPLFIEEIVSNIASASSTTIPATLQDLLAARIDNLGQAKATAQLAACIGREFDLQLLQASSSCSAQEIDEQLSLLRESGLLIELEETTAQFKHALIQDVCYQSQTRADRRAAHRNIAQALLAEFPHLVATRQELVAQHLFASGDAASAAEYWAMAGRRDIAIGANKEAIEHLNDALQALHTLAPDGSHSRLETMLYLNLGAAWMSAGGYGCAEAREAHLKAMALSGGENDHAGLFATMRRLWMADYLYMGPSAAIEMAEQMLHLARQTNDPVQLQAAHDAFGVSISSMGNSASGLYHYTQAEALYRPEHNAEMISQFGENVAINNGVHLAMTLWLRGFPEQSRAQVEATLKIARAQTHPHSLCIALYGCALISRWDREVDASACYVEESIALADEFAMPFWQLLAAADWAWISAMRGQQQEVLTLTAQIRAAPDIPGAAKILFFQQLADALLHLALDSEALEVLDDAITLAHQREDRYLEADYYLMKAFCVMKISPSADPQAESLFEEALSISRQQGSLSLELRAATGMAKLWHMAGRIAEARHLLEDICGRFEEGLDSVDFRAATALLDRCRQ